MLNNERSRRNALLGPRGSSVSSRIKYLDYFKIAACSDSSAAERDVNPTQRNSDFRQSEHVRRLQMESGENSSECGKNQIE
jgi:hypothetical protein